MNDETLMIFFISLAGLLIIDGIILSDLFVRYKNKRIVNDIVGWQGTKKPIIWTLAWCAGYLCDILVFLLISCIKMSREWVALVCIVAAALCLICFTVYTIIYKKLKNKR